MVPTSKKFSPKKQKEEEEGSNALAMPPTVERLRFERRVGSAAGVAALRPLVVVEVMVAVVVVVVVVVVA